MIKLKDLLTEKKFIPTITIEKYGKEISVKKFKSENDAVKYRKQMMKKYKLKWVKGFWGNPKTGIELTQNFSQENMMINMKDLIKQQGNTIRKESGMIKEENESTWTIVYKGLLAGFKKSKDKRLEVVARAVSFLIKTQFGRAAKNDFIKAFKKSL